MPKCRLFGRSWNVASDNFVYLGILDGTVRLAWSMMLAHSYFTSFPARTEREPLYFFVVFFLFINTADAGMAFWLAKISSRGPMVYLKNAKMLLKFQLDEGLSVEQMRSPRRGTRYVIYVRIPMLILELIWLIYGTYQVVGFVNPETLLQKAGLLCSLEANPSTDPMGFTGNGCLGRSYLERSGFDRLLGIARRVMLFGWTLFIILVVKLYWMFDPLGNMDYRQQEPTTRKLIEFEKRIKWKVKGVVKYMVSFFGQTGSSAKIMDFVANLLSVYLSSFNPSLTLSDIWAGVILVNAWQTPYRDAPLVSKPKASNEPIPEWMNKQNTSWYLQYASGIYGWRLHSYAVFQRHGFRMMLRSVWYRFRCRMMHHPVVLDSVVENCCQCQTDLVRNAVGGLKHARLMVLSYKNSDHVLPFFVGFEERITDTQPTIVISIRGTFSVNDALTDLSMAVASLDEEEVLWYKGHGVIHVHKGFLKCARNIIAELSTVNMWSRLDQMFQARPKMNLVITGHSLGAGVGAVLAMLLRDRYSMVRAFLYGSPGYVLSANAIKASKEFILTVFIGYDCVCRMSYQSMVTLSSKTQNAIVNSLVPKYKIQWACIKRLFGYDSPELLQMRRIAPENLNLSQLVILEESEDENDSCKDLNHELESFKSESKYAGITDYLGNPLRRCSYSSEKLMGLLAPMGDIETFQDLYLPGRILYLPRFQDTTFGKWRWSDATEFRELVLGRFMLLDHMAHNVYGKLVDPDIRFP